jgi:hypothetical protein
MLFGRAIDGGCNSICDFVVGRPDRCIVADPSNFQVGTPSDAYDVIVQFSEIGLAGHRTTSEILFVRHGASRNPSCSAKCRTFCLSSILLNSPERSATRILIKLGRNHSSRFFVPIAPIGQLELIDEINLFV